MVRENVRTVISQSPETRETQYSTALLTTINELAPLTHQPQQRRFDSNSPIVTSDDSSRMETSSRNIAMKIILDFILLATPAIVALLLYLFVDPFERGFFCNDESLIHPFREDTVTTLMLALVGGFIAILTITIVESIRASRNSDALDKRIVIVFNRNVPVLVQRLYHYIGILLFVMSVNQFLTDMAKYAVGRYRPHFIDVCQPLMPNDTTCKDEVNHHRYIQEFKCTNSLATDHMLKNMRLSFPSGHSSFAFAVAVFIVIYIQARITWRGSTLFKHFLQLLFITAATYTALSRISDYKHHWSDVFGGFILGTGIAIVLAYCATDFFKPKTQHRMTRRESTNGVSNHQV